METKTASQNRLKFYQILGKVFYSLAIVDNVVREKEIDKLREILKHEWLPLEDSEDIFGTDAAYQIEIVFDWLLDNDWDEKSVLSDFEYFKNEHPSLFTKKVNDLILKTVNAIADSFSGKNQKEIDFIDSLKMKLKH